MLVTRHLRFGPSNVQSSSQHLSSNVLVGTRLWSLYTFFLSQVKSVVPFSEPFTVDPENPPPEKDYEEYFKGLKEGITGKEFLEKSPTPVWFLNPESSHLLDHAFKVGRMEGDVCILKLSIYLRWGGKSIDGSFRLTAACKHAIHNVKRNILKW